MNLQEIDAEPTQFTPDAFRLDSIRQRQSNNNHCTTSCVTGCGELAESPTSTAASLTACFAETCRCENKFWDDHDRAQSLPLATQYFNMIHNLERVDYLIMQHDRELYLAQQDLDGFLKEVEIRADYKYLGPANPDQAAEKGSSKLKAATVVSLMVCLLFLLRFAYQMARSRFERADVKKSVNFDCEQAILKKYKLENRS